MAEATQAELEEKAKSAARKFILIFVVVCTIVPFLLLFRGSHAWKVIDRFGWKRVPCEILNASVERTARNPWYPYEPKIKYRYVLNGVAHESESVGEARFALYEEADRAIQQMLRSRNYCYVGGRPPESLLFRFSADHRFDLYYAGGFVCFAIILFLGQLLIKTLNGLKVLRRIAFAGLFLLVVESGLFMSVTMVRGIWKTSRAMKWPQVSCSIVLSTLQSDRGDGRMIYRPDIVYRYQAKGQDFISSRVDFFQEGANKPDRELLAKYPTDSEAVCYVNPGNAAESVLAPKWSASHLGLTAMGLFLTALGGALLWFFVWPHKIKPQQFAVTTTETVLEPVRNWWSVVWVGLFSVFVNIAIILQFFVGVSVRPGLKWIPWAALVGMNAFVLRVGWSWLKPVFLPKVALRLPQNHLVSGATTTIAWDVPKNTKSFELSLFCVEWRSNTEAVTEIYNEKLFSEDNPEQIGKIAFTLPETALKSMIEKDHAVDWAFKVRLNSGTWRNIETLYLVRVV